MSKPLCAARLAFAILCQKRGSYRGVPKENREEIEVKLPLEVLSILLPPPIYPNSLKLAEKYRMLRNLSTKNAHERAESIVTLSNFETDLAKYDRVTIDLGAKSHV